MKQAAPPRMSQDQLLAARPVRLVTAAIEPAGNGGGAIKVPLAQRRWPFRLPAGATKTFELDRVGVFVWNRLDGHTPIRNLVESVAAEYRLNLREAQVPTLKFLELLVRKGLVGLSPGDAESECATPPARV